jgi:beta-glucosidase
MTDDERFSLLISVMGHVPGSSFGSRDPRLPASLTNMSAAIPQAFRGWASRDPVQRRQHGRHQPRLPSGRRRRDRLPSLIALGASFNPQLVRQGGEAIGREARSRASTSSSRRLQPGARPAQRSELRVLLRGPLPQRRARGEQVNGIQSQGVVSTLKHFTLNATRPTATGSTPSSTLLRIASRTSSPSRSRSSARGPAPS